MINSLIQAISISLNTEFGDDYKIYMEEIKQGLTEPCFLLSCINPSHELVIGRRYYRENSFVIHYFPTDRNKVKEECNEVAERLYLCLEWITVDDDLIKGNYMKYEIVDGILHFFVDYNFFMIKQYNPERMNDITQTITLKDR